MLDGAVNVRVGEFVEFPCARQVAVFGSRGCCIGRFAVDDAESHLALRAIHIALRDLAETVDGRAERKIRGLRLIIRPHPHTCGTLADGIGRLEVDGHLGLAGMLTGVCARIWHATATVPSHTLTMVSPTCDWYHPLPSGRSVPVPSVK